MQHKQDEQRWFVQVAILGRAMLPEHYSMGPLSSWTRARDVADKWESEHGPNTAHVVSRKAEDARLHGVVP